MRVEPTKQAVFPKTTGGFAYDGALHAPADESPRSRALVVVAPPPPGEPAARARQAAFLAHLIATKEHAPQTRERRRAEPKEALAAYRAAAALMRG